MIRINIYNNSILASAKCGSRFLDSIWEDKYCFFSDELINHINLPIQIIIVRPPLEHLKSALHTDLLLIWDEKRDKSEEQKLLNLYTLNRGGVHYELDFYKELYEFWCLKDKKPKILNLSDLTNLVDEFGVEYNYNENDYNWKPLFEVWKTKEEILYYVEKNYPNQYNILMDNIKSETEYYLKLTNETFCCWNINP